MLKKLILYGVCIMILISLVGCGNENGIHSVEPASVTESGSNSELAEEYKKTTTTIENSHNETTESMQEQKTSENTSQTAHSATIEKQIYLPEEEYKPTNVSDAEELYVFLNGLSYSNETCDGLSEYSISFDDGSQYYVNITEGWIQRDKKEARLTSDEIALISNLMQ